MICSRCDAYFCICGLYPDDEMIERRIRDRDWDRDMLRMPYLETDEEIEEKVRRHHYHSGYN